jgi:hypothetical protein
MPKIPTDFYNDKYVYGIRCNEPRFPAPSATFEQCGEIIRRVAALLAIGSRSHRQNHDRSHADPK